MEGRKKEGAKGNVSPKSPEVGRLFIYFLSDFLLIDPCDVLVEASKIAWPPKRSES